MLHSRGEIERAAPPIRARVRVNWNSRYLGNARRLRVEVSAIYNLIVRIARTPIRRPFRRLAIACFRDTERRIIELAGYQHADAPEEQGDFH